jgi:hypothetical protein
MLRIVILLTQVFLVPLFLTLVVELPVIVIAGRGSAAAWRAGVLVNTLTNPVAVLAILVLTPIVSPYSAPAASALLGVIEVAVVIVEWRVFRWALGWSNRRAMTTSVIANGLSFGLGLALAVGGFLGF